LIIWDPVVTTILIILNPDQPGRIDVKKRVVKYEGIAVPTLWLIGLRTAKKWIGTGKASLLAAEIPSLCKIEVSFNISLIPIELLAYPIVAVAEGCASDSDACKQLFAEGSFCDAVSSPPWSQFPHGSCFQ
jgi:hypothetical protein